ncbi:MAG: molybdenum ABC transporter ATP-binding protein [Rhodospirillaceae bacterium]|nr:molybdenum ABC transporter ATP-binding protein [Rhodospirillaceae bacterium]
MSFDIDVEVRRGDFALKIAFQAAPGLTALFGPSGAGKTSILNMIAGVLKPARGRIAVDGQVLFDSETRVDLKSEHRRVGYIFQDARLFPHMSVRSNLLYGYRLAKKTARYAEPDHVMNLLGIAGLVERRPASLSGGEQQRVAIGRALLSSPRLLLMDEPLAALDDARKLEILPHIERLRDELKIPILYVTHARAEVERLAVAVIGIEKGRVTSVT